MYSTESALLWFWRRSELRAFVLEKEYDDQCAEGVEYEA